MAAEPNRRGASQAQAGLSGQLRSYYAHHWATFKESWLRLWATPLSTLLTWLLVGVALSLPSGLYLLLSNADSVRADWQGSAQITLYLKSQTSRAAGQQLAVSIAKDQRVMSADYTSAEKALADFEKLSGIEGITAGFAKNPLPASVAVVLAEQTDLPAVSRELLASYSQMPEVAEAQLDQQWLARLYQLMQVAGRLAWALASLLAIAIVLVIGNTIRLSIENRRDEILIVKLSGGTNAYVQRPFLYYGLLFGLGGGLSCMLILLAIYFWIAPPLSALGQAYGSSFALQGPSWLDGLLLLFFASLLGIIGAWVAVVRHLRAIEPQ